MKIVTFANRWLRPLIGLWDRLGHQPHLAIGRTVPVIRLPRQASPKPIGRWWMNPVSGRLECRWTVAVNRPTAGAESSGIERLGAILSLREKRPAVELIHDVPATRIRHATKPVRR